MDLDKKHIKNTIRNQYNIKITNNDIIEFNKNKIQLLLKHKYMLQKYNLFKNKIRELFDNNISIKLYNINYIFVLKYENNILSFNNNKTIIKTLNNKLYKYYNEKIELHNDYLFSNKIVKYKIKKDYIVYNGFTSRNINYYDNIAIFYNNKILKSYKIYKKHNKLYYVISLKIISLNKYNNLVYYNNKFFI